MAKSHWTSHSVGFTLGLSSRVYHEKRGKGTNTVSYESSEPTSGTLASTVFTFGCQKLPSLLSPKHTGKCLQQKVNPGLLNESQWFYLVVCEYLQHTWRRTRSWVHVSELQSNSMSRPVTLNTENWEVTSSTEAKTKTLGKLAGCVAWSSNQTCDSHMTCQLWRSTPVMCR